MDNQIKVWLKTALIRENLQDFSVKIVGNSEKGDGYIGDIKFIEVSGCKNDQNKTPVNYSLVLKCSKDSQLLREKAPIKETFDSEILLYDTIVPAFTLFQQSKNVQNIFDSVPKYYGFYRDTNREILVLENMKKIGYDLYNKYLPLTRQHIELVLKEYGKWHAISVAMQDQVPETFQETIKNLNDVFPKYVDIADLKSTFVKCVKDTFPLFENDFNEEMMSEWKQFVNQVPDVTDKTRNPGDHLMVVAHADCWNNNFLFKTKDNPQKVAIVDWQATALLSPVIDISYFLYTCISSEDLKDFDLLLELYYESFSDHLLKLGSDPQKLYPLKQLKIDWLKFAKFGVLMCVFGVKATMIKKEDSPDFVESVEKRENISDAFDDLISQSSPGYKERIQCVIEHALTHGIIREALWF